MRARWWGCPRRLVGERGQAMVEMGLAILLLVTLTMGILELGRTWMVINMITHAARDGARAAAVMPASNRNDEGFIVDTSAIETLVANQIAEVGIDSLSVDVTYPDTGGTPMVAVTVSGNVGFLFNLLAESFAVDRTVTFRDEGR